MVSAAKGLLLLCAFAFLTIAALIVVRRVGDRDRRSDWIGAVVGPAAIMIFALAVNGLAFAGEAFLSAAMESDSGVPMPGEVLPDLAAVVLGSAGLMWLVCAALRRDDVYEQASPEMAGLIAQKQMIESLLVRHWLAVVGLAAVFGIMSGRGPVMLLAIELTLMWIFCVVTIAVKKRRTAARRAIRPADAGRENPPRRAA